MNYLLRFACVGALGALAGCYVSLQPAADPRDGGSDVAPDAPEPPGPDVVPPRDVPPGVETGICVPSTEVCNGFDDDCNGLTDENIRPVTCGVGDCLRTAPGCVNGTPGMCSPGQPQRETCNDGRDNDCNGFTDDAFDCGDPCQPEFCNGVDDDCNGLVDDGLGSVGCGQGACQRVVASCVNGMPQTCVPGAPSMEVCNGIDDDCDGQVDDGLMCQTCGGVADPLDAWFYRAAVEVADIDETEIASGIFTGLITSLPPVDQTPMVQRAGDCIFDPSPPTMTARDLNLGTIEVTQPSGLNLAAMFDPAMQHYTSSDAVNSDALVDGQQVDFTFMGGPNGGGMHAFHQPPPRLSSATVQWPMSVIHGQPFTVTFPSQPASSDLTAVLMLFDNNSGASQAAVICAVPICRGSITVPGEITANVAHAQDITYLRFVRTTQLQFTPVVRARSSYGTIHVLNVQ